MEVAEERDYTYIPIVTLSPPDISALRRAAMGGILMLY